ASALGGAVADKYEPVVQRVVGSASVVVLIGGLDTGKSTLGRAIVRDALEAGRRPAFVDADLGQKTVGPPGCVALRMLEGPEDLQPDSLAVPDALYFVGSTSPQGQLLPLVVGTGLLLARAQNDGADLVVVDPTGL